MLRSVLVVTLLAVASIFSILSSVAVWADRQFLNEDAFVGNAQEAFDQESVELALAARLSTVVIDGTQIQQRISDAITSLATRDDGSTIPGLALLERSLSRALTEAINNAALTVVQSDNLESVRDNALRVAHRGLMAIVTGEGEVVRTEDRTVVLDLRPIVQEIVARVPGGVAERLLVRLDVPPDAGQIVLINGAEQPWLWRGIRFLDLMVPWLPIVTAVLLVAGIAASRNRRRTLIVASLLVAVMGVLTLVLVAGPAAKAATSWPPTDQGRLAAEDVYEVLLNSFRQQQRILVVGALAVAALAWLAGFVLARRRSDAPAPAAGGPLIPATQVPLYRATGFGLAAALMVLSPVRSVQWVIFIGILLVIYLVVLERLSGGQVVVSFDSVTGKAVSPGTEGGGFRGWLRAWRVPLRIGMVFVAAAVLLLWPDATAGTLLATVVLLFMALAVFEVVIAEDDATAAEPGSPPASPTGRGATV